LELAWHSDLKLTMKSYGSSNQHWHMARLGRADLLVSQKAARQRRPTAPMCQSYCDLLYTDAGQVPLREVIGSLPGFGGQSDSRIHSRTLGASGQEVSPTVLENEETKTENRHENTGGSHRYSRLVTVSYEDSNWRREGDSNPTKFRQ
jgi:hypothetical protein